NRPGNIGQNWHQTNEVVSGLAGATTASSFSTSLSAFISGRNKSIIGHGLLYFSDEAIEKAQGEFIGMIKECFNHEFREKWMHYKRVSRPLKLNSLISEPNM
ncbi:MULTISPECIES: hypothetical protein, partial [Marinobacter]|uniref:hypothetical protein n=1 Tax=Marinobacter TaxID=2742 RepID=UPI001B2A9647